MAAKINQKPGYRLGNISAGQRAKQLLFLDLDKMKKGNLGASDAELQQATSAAQSNIGAQTGAQQAAIARAGLVGGQANQGALHNVQQQIAQESARASGQAAAQIRGDDLAMQAQEADIIRQRLSAQQDRRRQNAQIATRSVGKAATSVLGVVTSLLGAVGGAAKGGS